MRYLGMAAMAVLLVIAIGGAVQAGDFHRGTQLICSDCHTMHFSVSHGYNPDGSGITTPLDPGGPFHFLLRNEINQLCLSCHDSQGFAPDVFKANTGANIRQAGALNEVGGDTLYPESTGHTLGSTDEAPGSNPPLDFGPDGLQCINCHGAHGANFVGINPYRNLGGFGTQTGGGFAISYSVGGAPDTTKDVYETAAARYDISNVWFMEPDSQKSKMAEFCKSCHTDFHGAVGGEEIGGVPHNSAFEEFIRHPSAGVDIGVIGGGHSSLGVFTGHDNQVKVMDPDGNQGNWTTASTALTPTCISCHKGHGNQNAFGLIFMSGSGTVTEEGDTSGTGVRDLCKQCHVQGG